MNFKSSTLANITGGILAARDERGWYIVRGNPSYRGLDEIAVYPPVSIAEIRAVVKGEPIAVLLTELPRTRYGDIDMRRVDKAINALVAEHWKEKDRDAARGGSAIMSWVKLQAIINKELPNDH